MGQLLGRSWCEAPPATITAGVDSRRCTSFFSGPVHMNDELVTLNCNGSIFTTYVSKSFSVIGIVMIRRNGPLSLRIDRFARFLLTGRRRLLRSRWRCQCRADTHHKDDEESQAERKAIAIEAVCFHDFTLFLVPVVS